MYYTNNASLPVRSGIVTSRSNVSGGQLAG